MGNPFLNTARHPIGDERYAAACAATLEADGALVLSRFFTAEAIDRILDEARPREAQAFYAASTHNIYLTPPNETLPAGHPHNRQIRSSKGLIADDQIPRESPLREIYEDEDFRTFLCRVLDIESVHPYADRLSSINVHYAAEGMELGWHFDNSSFAVTALLQAPEAGGVFEYVPNMRGDGGAGASERQAAVLDGREPVRILSFDPGDLVLFRGREALHRVTPTQGATTRMLVVFAFNDQPGVELSESALQTFYGRTT